MLVICNGMIRSGSTLQYNLVRALVERMGRGAGEGFVPGEQFKKEQSRLRSWALSGQIHVIKSHLMHQNATRLAGEGEVRMCYIFRDIRDVAASVKQKWGFAGRTLRRRLDSAIEVYEQMQDMPGVFWQRYEDVMEDLPAAVQGLAYFLNLNPSEIDVRAVAKECSLSKAQVEMNRVAEKFTAIDHLRQRLNQYTPAVFRGIVLRRFGIVTDTYDERTLLHSNHISEDHGAAGKWKNILSAREREMIEKRYGTWLSQAGYL